VPPIGKSARSQKQNSALLDLGSDLRAEIWVLYKEMSERDCPKRILVVSFGQYSLVKTRFLAPKEVLRIAKKIAINARFK